MGRLAELDVTGGVNTHFVYDGAAMIAEYDGSGTVMRRYVHGPGMDAPLVQIEGSATTPPAGARRWLLADERGSIYAHADEAGAIVQTNTYDEYGRPGDSNQGRFGYTGQIWLAEAGLYHYKARAYHAELGVFMQSDPIGHSGGINLYAYVGGDPVNFTDPWGLKPECPTGQIPNSKGECVVDRVVATGRRFARGGWGGGWIFSWGSRGGSGGGGGANSQGEDEVVAQDCNSVIMGIGNFMVDASNFLGNASLFSLSTGVAASRVPSPYFRAGAGIAVGAGVITSYAGVALHIGSGVAHGIAAGPNADINDYRNVATGSAALAMGGVAGAAAGAAIKKAMRPMVATANSAYARMVGREVSTAEALGAGVIDAARSYLEMFTPEKMYCEE